MALGSSAPEILLSVIETVTLLEDTPGELGPSTIVGSAAFNLLVISAVSILSVGEKPKRIDDMGVFAITSISSIFAYVWLFIVLGVWTKDQVTMVEAVLTFGFFFVLIILAYAADKINERKKDKLKTAEQKKAEQKKQI
jgi:solute carrier family 8 (sodium/calcium exchanger)